MQDGKPSFSKPKSWAVYADMVMDELRLAWEKGVTVLDASVGIQAHVYVKCIFAIFDYPGNRIKHFLFSGCCMLVKH